MPLYKTITVNATTEILVWKITESITQLRAEAPLKEKSARRLNGMKSELHQRGFLSVRKLLQEKGYTDVDLHYDQFGKPYFEDGKHISISHSHSFSTIIISDQVAGIDLEMRRDKIAVIADKFINPKEFADLNKEAADYINKLTVLWGIKEVIFKIRSEAGISFKDHIKAEPFDMQDLKTTAWLEIEHLHQSFAVYFEEIENFTLVYAFENL